MEFSCEIGDLREELNSEKGYTEEKEFLTEASLIPKDKVLLGLDISEASSGICVYEKGEKLSANIVLESKDGDFLEVRLRRELKECLSEVVSGKEFDLIIIEDAFQGINPKVTRKLYALNTAIDELILDGVCKCKKFLRVNNQQWKSWLFTIDKDNLYKGLDDKKRIEECLRLLGVYENGSEGYQDRLDSCGMLLGYFLCKDTINKQHFIKSLKKISWSDIEYGYEEEIEFVKILAGYGSRDIMTIFIDDKRLSKDLIISKLTEIPNAIYITRNPINLGILGHKLGVNVIPDGGYFGFWVKERKLSKYIDLNTESIDERFEKINS